MLLAMEPHQQCGELQDRTPLHVASSRGHVRHPKMERNGWLLKLGIFLWVATYDSLGGFTTILHILQLKQIQVLMKGILHCLEQWRGRWMLELLMERKVHEDTYIYISMYIIHVLCAMIVSRIHHDSVSHVEKWFCCLGTLWNLDCYRWKHSITGVICKSLRRSHGYHAQNDTLISWFKSSCICWEFSMNTYIHQKSWSTNICHWMFNDPGPT